MSGDRARASVLVKVDPEEAFRIFTEEIDQWWRRGRAFRVGAGRRGFLHIEPKLDGRLYESFETKTRTRVIETGRVVVWEPPTRLVFRWRAVNFAPDESTQVEVLFEPQPSGTLVTVTHTGWSSIRDDHPARHGQPSAAFLANMGMWWGQLLSALREHTEP